MTQFIVQLQCIINCIMVSSYGNVNNKCYNIGTYLDVNINVS
jgi:hypothetical protein